MRVAKGIEVELVRLLMLVNIWVSGTRMYRNPIKALRATRKMVSVFNRASRGIKVKRAFVLDGRYSWDMFNPHWPSKAFNRFYNAQLREYVPVKENPLVLRRILVAITKKCPLRCEHCSEWDTLNEKDHLSLEQYEEYLDAFVRDGVAQIVYSGGEPLNRFKDLILLIHRYRKNTNQWIYTSGYNLSLEKAQQLKNAGLNGVSISLDHHLEEAHNLFRGNAKSFNWVEKAVKNCKEANLLVSINTCITKKYLQQNGLNSIVDLAKEWEVPIVNILEPRAVGHYAQKDVEYSISEKQLVEKQVLEFNKSTNKKLPFVQYPAMLRSGMPCGGGRSYLLLDSDGTLRPCPFCKTPISKPSIEINNCEADALAYS
jgi:MoaA/NifB/PqqE/SkfB family radical SAM enzyme